MFGGRALAGSDVESDEPKLYRETIEYSYTDDHPVNNQAPPKNTS